MAKKSGQKARILELKQLFEEETDQSKGFTSAELCGKFDINRKSIYDDIEVLSASGFEIMKQKSGQTTYYYHDDKLFELSELKLLTDAVLSSRVISEKQSKKIIDKLKSLTGPSYRSVLNRQIYSNKNKHDITNQITYVIDEAQIAIAEHKNIEFRYYRWNMEKKLVERHPGRPYNVSPLTLAWADENYYLIAYDIAASRIKHFRVDKIKDIKKLDTPITTEYLSNKDDIAEYLNKNFNMYGGSSEMQITLECRSGYMENAIIDRFGASVPIIKIDDKTFRTYIKVYPSDAFFSWLIGLGSDVKIVDPPDVAVKIKKLAEDIVSLYK